VLVCKKKCSASGEVLLASITKRMVYATCYECAPPNFVIIHQNDPPFKAASKKRPEKRKRTVGRDVMGKTPTPDSHLRQISRTVLIPTATTSGRARSCTNWFTSCRKSGSSASGGTNSWHAVAVDASNRVTSRWLGCTYRCVALQVAFERQEF
jgi:hypothetical protein